MKPGTVYWITGLAGVGKTTIGKLLYKLLKKTKPNVVFLDGDTMREIFGNSLGHSLEDRLKLTMSYTRICKMIADQGIDVVCATVSMFRSCRQWNRKHITDYKEIYLQVPMEVLMERDTKQLYSRAKKGEIKNVIGVDLQAEEPENSDIVIYNDGSVPPEEIAKKLFETFQ